MEGEMLKILISADFECASGAVTWRHTLPERRNQEFERIQRYWMGDINAAIEGALNGSPDIDFLVTEAHYEMTYIIPDQLHPRAEYISGFLKRDMHLAGLDSSYDGVFLFTHGRAGGSATGVLSHTLVGTIHNVFLNGEPAGELRLNAALAGSYGVPVALVVGDTDTCREANDVLGDNIITAETKAGLDRFAARCLRPQNSQSRIKAAAQAAIEALPLQQPYMVEKPYELLIEFQMPTMAVASAMIPSVDRIDPRTISIISDNFSEIYNLAHLCALLSITRFVNDSTV
jgi:D-amino peptidase